MHTCAPLRGVSARLGAAKTRDPDVIAVHTLRCNNRTARFCFKRKASVMVTSVSLLANSNFSHS